MRKRKNSGLSNVVTDLVELECGWIGRRLHRYFPVADFNARRLGRVAVARMFQKTGWSERGRCDVWQLSSIGNGKDNRRLSGVRQDGLRSSWMDS